MIPKSLSASALNVAELCLARYKAEYIDKIPRYSTNTAADVGTAVHLALENYVQDSVVGGLFVHPEKVMMAIYWEAAYAETFDTADKSTPEFEDGKELCFKWLDRTSFEGTTVVSTELKESFPVPTTAGELAFNYILDRADQIADHEYRVVDYKTIRVPIQADQLKNKIQVRCYALAYQIKHPDAEKIWVVLDQLRHEPVGKVFTREDQIATWNYVKKAAERIIASDGTEETLNPECRYCPRAVSCETLNKNIDLDGIFSVKTMDQAIEMKSAIEGRMSAEKGLLEQLNDMLMRHAENNDVIEWDTDAGYHAQVTARKMRTVDTLSVARIIGAEMMASYGKIGITDIDRLLKSSQLSELQKLELKKLISVTVGSPSVKITPKNPIDD